MNNANSNSEDILDFYLSNMNTYYNVQKFLLLYEGIPIVFPELGIFKTPYKEIIKIRKIFREMFSVDDIRYNENEIIETRIEEMRKDLRKSLLHYLYNNLNNEATDEPVATGEEEEKKTLE